VAIVDERNAAAAQQINQIKNNTQAAIAALVNKSNILFDHLRGYK
jgi:hypothetical protein